MNIVSLILRQLVGMFIDDEFLAVAVLAVVGAAALLILFGVPPLVAGGALLVGCIAVLMLSALRANRKT